MNARLAALGTIVAHALALAVLLRVSPQVAPAASPATAIELHVTARSPAKAPAKPPSPSTETPRPTPGRRPSRRAPSTATRSMTVLQNWPPASERAASNAIPSSSQPLPPSSPAAVDLFPGAVLSTVSGAVPVAGFGGHLRRASDGASPRDAVDDGPAVTGRVDRWMRDAVGESDVESGHVDPAWRDAEREVVDLYHPQAPLITDESPTYTYLKQWQRARPSSGGPEGGIARAIDPSAETMEGRAMAQFAAGQQALGQPAEWRRTIVEAIVDSDGTVRSLRVAEPCGRRRLDALAVDAVQGALARRPPRDPRGRVIARFAVEAAVVARPPPIAPVLGPGGAVVGAGLDLVGIAQLLLEKKRTGDARSVRTRVHLLSVEKAP